jgi:hypothetical protein
MVASLADSSQLHYKNSDGAEQKDMNHATLMKDSAHHKPGQKKY